MEARDYYRELSDACEAVGLPFLSVCARFIVRRGDVAANEG
jgi:hypothetical protein